MFKLFFVAIFFGTIACLSYSEIIISKLKALAVVIRKSSKKNNEDLLSDIVALSSRSNDTDLEIQEFDTLIKGMQYFVTWQITKTREVLLDILKKIHGSNMLFLDCANKKRLMAEMNAEREFSLLISEIEQGIIIVKDLEDDSGSYVVYCSAYWETCRHTMKIIGAILQNIRGIVKLQKESLVNNCRLTDEQKEKIRTKTLMALASLDPYIKRFEQHVDL